MLSVLIEIFKTIKLIPKQLDTCDNSHYRYKIHGEEEYKTSHGYNANIVLKVTDVQLKYMLW